MMLYLLFVTLIKVRKYLRLRIFLRNELNKKQNAIFPHCSDNDRLV